MEKPFPSPTELTVAEALLLLASLNPPCAEVEFFEPKKQKKIETGFVYEYSSPPSYEIVKRSRSKRYRKPNLSGVWRNQAISKSEATDVSSLSSERSTVSGLRSQPPMRVSRSSLWSASLMSTRGSGKESLKKRNKVSSPYIMRRAEAILKLLSAGCASEITIRQVLGDSPDTSKALRMLLRMEEVKRSGAGGYRDPYVYMVAESRSEVDSV